MMILGMKSEALTQHAAAKLMRRRTRGYFLSSTYLYFVFLHQV